jgi:hypothetical protein
MLSCGTVTHLNQAYNSLLLRWIVELNEREIKACHGLRRKKLATRSKQIGAAQRVRRLHEVPTSQGIAGE